ncbi:hypothetical protein N864_11830 [Intrasporangium chromatireducens Q5-1]|uniref:GerMN domain-containing protein n=1 Tax=Intrasporangium chromatireducens Q5-1 TaxID=584657 RepID=W9GPC5_9MICO|nr:Gmad2 immunoglobulin-like domain-containing protein [Intrasporangium chromatireducens]EWT06927.1 hypothetical protein N864_11830 [Intrasporangium chromatireducens Q5-1]
MSTDDRNEGRRPEDDTVVIGAGLQPVEETLRGELHREAGSIRPHDRLDSILAEAHGSQLTDAATDPVESGRHRWLLPVAAAALAAVIAGGVWVANRPTSTAPPAASPTTTSQPSATSGTATSSGTETMSTSASTTGSGSAPVPAQTVSLPVYYAGPRTDGSTQLVLFREFGPAQVAAPGDAGAKATAALEQAVAGGPSGAAYQPLWQGVQVEQVTVKADRIDVSLSTGARGLDAGQGQVAVDQLVWTAQAAVGKGNLPVHFTLADGSTALAGDLTTDKAYTRPTDEMAVWEVLSPLWIDSPSRGEVVPAGAVTVTGVASTNEANVQWKIAKSGTTIATGHTTAAVSAPARGAYSFTTDPLPAGDYVVTVFETSMKDGSVSAMATRPFTVK